MLHWVNKPNFVHFAGVCWLPLARGHSQSRTMGGKDGRKKTRVSIFLWGANSHIFACEMYFMVFKVFLGKLLYSLPCTVCFWQDSPVLSYASSTSEHPTSSRLCLSCVRTEVQVNHELWWSPNQIPIPHSSGALRTQQAPCMFIPRKGRDFWDKEKWQLPTCSSWVLFRDIALQIPGRHRWKVPGGPWHEFPGQERCWACELSGKFRVNFICYCPEHLCVLCLCPRMRPYLSNRNPKKSMWFSLSPISFSLYL